MIKKNTKYKILTPTGYQPFSGIRKIQKDESFLIKFESGISITCSNNHRFMFNGKEKFAENLVAGDIVNNSSGDIEVVSIKKIIGDVELYDIINVGSGNVYITNDIVSHNCNFSTSGNTVMAIDSLDWYKNTYMKDPMEKRGIDGNFWVWQPANYTTTYIVSCDVARGDSSDYSTIEVFDTEALEQVAEYKGYIGTKDFGNMAVAIATEYNDALLVIENANVGWAAIQPAIDRNYKNLYFSHRSEEVLNDPLKHLKRGLDLTNKDNMIAGFTTSTKIRPMMISKLELYIREKSVIIRSSRLLNELAVFIWKNGKPQAQSGHNDDLVMATCIGLWVRDTALQLKQAGVDLNRAMLDSFTRVGAVYSNLPVGKDPWKWNPNPNGDDEDLKWLIR